MAKPPKKLEPEKIKSEPGAWERFEHAVDAAVKSGPKHRRGKPTQPPKSRRGEATKDN